MSYGSDRGFSDQFLPRLRQLIGPYLLVPSSFEQDTKQAADLVILRGCDMTIGCRVRRHGYAESFPRQFTLRSHRDNGAMTEFRKVLEGWGDWFFYGHATKDGLDIKPWWLIDLAHFRFHLVRDARRTSILKKPGRIREGEIDNCDGTRFRYFEIDSFLPDPPLLIAASDMTSAAEQVSAIHSAHQQALPLHIPTADEIFGKEAK